MTLFGTLTETGPPPNYNPNVYAQPGGMAAPTQAQQDAKAYINSVLDTYGLQSLSDWAWQQIVSGQSSVQVLQGLREQSAYKQRFAGMAIRAQKGYNAISEADYLNLENSYRQTARAYGLPADYYDNASDFTALIGGDVSVKEYSDRVQSAAFVALQAPPDVRQALSDYYGVGPGDIIAYWLDPQKTTAILQQRELAAQIGAIAGRGGTHLTATQAERAGTLGATQQQVADTFMTGRELLNNLPGENVNPIDTNTVIEGAFGGNQDAATLLANRRRARQQAFAGGGGLAETSRGVIGLGVSGQ